jgi:hypothetical protein
MARRAPDGSHQHSSRTRGEGTLVLSILVAGCGGAAGGPPASASVTPRSVAPTASPSVAAPPSPAAAASDIVSTTPALALTKTSVPIGSARPLTDYVVGRTLAAPGMGTTVFADGAVWAVDRKDGGFTATCPTATSIESTP